MKNKLLLTFLAIVCVVCCVCALAACGGEDVVRKMGMSREDLTLGVGDTEQLSAYPMPSSAKDTSVSWKSYDKSVATVDNNGVVTAVSAGETIIAAISANGVEGQCRVTVIDPSSVVTLDKSSMSLFDKGQSERLTATMLSNHSYTDIKWYASPEGVVKIVTTNDTNQVEIVPNKIGKATVTVEVVSSDSTYRATCNVTVVEAPVKVNRVTLNKDSLTLELDEEAILLASVEPDKATHKDVVWSVSPSGIVSVDNGKVKALAIGTATVTATADGISATCDVKVIDHDIGLEFELFGDDEGYTLSNHTEALKGDVIIPAQYNGLPVTAIGNYALIFCSQITSVTIPNSVTSIGKGAFYECFALTNVTISDSVTTIGEGAFSECIALTNVTIPDSVTTIGKEVFNGCTSLASVTIPNSVTTIGEGAFNRCTSLASVTIPDSVKNIGDRAFNECNALTNVTIPDSVTAIGRCAFSNSGLTSVTIGNGVSSIAELAFADCAQLTDITIPNSVNSIGERAFNYCSGLTSVTIGNGVTSFGYQVFQYCTALTSVTLVDGATVIGSAAFENCNALTSVSIPDSITSIGSNAFYGCDIQYNEYDGISYLGNQDNPRVALVKANVSQIDTCTIGEGTKIICTDAFNYCDIIDMIIPSSLKSIEIGAFYQSHVRKSVSVDNLKHWCTIKGIGELAYCNAGALYIDGQALTGKVIVPDGVTAIYDYTFSGCEEITSVVLPDGVTSIGANAFLYCKNLTGITIPNSVTSIGERAFIGCSKLAGITIPNGVTSIERQTFYECNGLLNVKIPDSVTSIGEQAFYRCKYLTDVIIPDSVTTIGWQAFYDCNTLTSITIPQNVTSIGNAAFARCGKLTTVYWNAVELINTEDTNGRIFDDFSNGFISMNSYVTTMIMGDSVKSVDKRVLEGCFFLETLTLNEGLQTLCDLQYFSFTSLSIPSTVTQMGDITDCENLVEISLAGELDISNVTFNNCPKFKGMRVGDFYMIGSKLTGAKDGVTTVIIPSTVTAIAAKAFQNATNFKYIYVPASVNDVESGAFTGCTATIFVGSNSTNGVVGATGTIYRNVGNCTEDGWIYQAGSTVTVKAYIGVGGAVTVPAQIDGKDVSTIGMAVGALTNVLLQRNDIPKLTISSSGQVVINGDAFKNCANLIEIEFGADVTQVAMSKAAFAGCNRLATISLAGGYDNYQLVIRTESGDINVYDITDGADLYAKINGAADGAACGIRSK